MNVFIIGKKSLSVEVLNGVLGLGVAVIGVSCPAGDKLGEAASGLGIPSLSRCPEGCDLIVMANAHRYVAKSERDRARYGAISFHPSLLPRHRGIDAVRWAVAFGDAVTGGTVYWVDNGYDTGPIFSQRVVFRMPGEDYHLLWSRMFPVGVEMLIDAVSRIMSGDRAAVPQCDLYATWEPAFTSQPIPGAT